MASSHDSPHSDRLNLVEGLLQEPLFSGLRPGPQKALLKFARIEELPFGKELIRQGEYTGDFYYVLRGLVTPYRTERDGHTEIFGEQLGPAKWFGELSALSNQPSLATLKVELACVVAVLESGLFKELHKAPGEFKEMIDSHYREQSLIQHLRVVPLLKGLRNDQLRRLRRCARFETVDAGVRLATQGEPAEEIFLIRSGAVTLHRQESGEEDRLVGYLNSNSSFGDHAFASEGEKWHGTYETSMPTEVSVLPIAAVRRVFKDEPETIQRLEAAAHLIAADDAGEATGIYDLPGDPADVDLFNPDQLEIMVHKQSIKGGEALVIDLQKCVRCNACVESCVAVHEDGIPRLSKKGNRIRAENNAQGKDLSLTTSCYHCETPGCMMACSYGAIRRDTQGLIRFVWDNCVGCAMCVSACPYDVIRLTAPPGEGDRGEDKGLLAKLPLIGDLFGKWRGTQGAAAEERGYHKDVEVKGKAVKCDRCAGLPFEACVYNCPCGAIERVPPSLIFEGLGEFASRPGGDS